MIKGQHKIKLEFSKRNTKGLNQLLSDLLRIVSRQEKNDSPSTALNILENYFQAAINQQRRIARQEMHKQMFSFNETLISKAVNLPQLFCDVHFYLISWNIIFKIVNNRLGTFKSSQTDLFPTVKELLKRYAKVKNDYNKARSYLEHIYKKLPGDSSRKQMQKPQEISRLDGTVLSLGGHKVDVGKDSLNKLRIFIAELKQALLNDCVEYLRNKAPSDLNRIIQRFHRNKETQKLQAKTIMDLREAGYAFDI